MPIFELRNDVIKRLQKTTFSDQGIRERQDIQRLLRDQIDIISDDTMVIAEEFGDWDSSRRRIDLLGIDKQANLVVIELKRTEDGGYMELQSVRYSAMISTMTFDQVVDAHRDYLRKLNVDEDAYTRILDFLGWSEPDHDAFAQDVRIVLASAEFSKELTSSVLWLNEKGIDIRCVKMEPFSDGNRIFLDIQQVIPLPETEQFQVQVRQKKLREQESRKSSRDFSKFILHTNEKIIQGLSKRLLVLEVVRAAIKVGATPEDIMLNVEGRQSNMFISFDGNLDEISFRERVMETDSGGQVPRDKRFFCNDDELFRLNNKTYALSNQWGVDTINTVNKIADHYRSAEISFSVE
ncbi:PDDEXK family nuclease [Thalassolituus marinus]|uniref:DUF91 domain-containing protein n=1 Tax=Thalassolituus marinus TaxID=671053 RepID=A0ABS7ZW36_9GAMM|nr:hypothetical protein [Thalassolituus marinus]MCA6065372.1 hypothetical protein [Thalassolituus marinus]